MVKTGRVVRGRRKWAVIALFCCSLPMQSVGAQFEGGHLKLPVDPTIAPTDQTMVSGFGLPPLEESDVFREKHHLQPINTNETVSVMSPNDTITNLQSGWYLIAPHHHTGIRTAWCGISVSRKAIALVHLKEHKVSVYDMSDSHAGDIRVSIGRKKIGLHPGQQFSVRHNADTVSGAPQVAIAVRNPQKVVLGEGLSGLFSEFSIPCALSNANLYKTLSHSNNRHDRAVLNRILKSAASVQTITSEYGPYEGAL